MNYTLAKAKYKILQPIVHKVLRVATDKVLGIDVSRWQGLMNWLIALNAGAKYAFIRAGSIGTYDGVCYEDVYFKLNSQTAYRYMPVGYYWYFRPNHSGLVQADYFTKLVEGMERKLPMVCDIETSGGLTPYYVEKRTKEFCDRLEQNLGEKPIIYTSQGFWHKNILSGINRPVWAVRLDLWVANFTLRPNPAMPVTWSEKDYTFWQWSADGNMRGKEFGAESRSIDLNYFNGNMEDFLKYLGGETEPPVIPPNGNGGDIVTVEGKMLNVLVPSLRIRSGPSTSYATVGGLRAGNSPIELGESKDSYGNDWSNIGWNQWSAKVYNGQLYMEYVTT